MGAIFLAVFERQYRNLAVVQHFFGLAFAEEAFEPAVFFREHDDHVHIVFAHEIVDGFLNVFVVDVVEAVGDVFEHRVEHLDFGGCVGGIVLVVVVDV